jgi:hypothetical protein
LPYWNWWHFPAGYTLVCAADLLIGRLLAGLVLARLAAPRGQTALLSTACDG